MIFYNIYKEINKFKKLTKNITIGLSTIVLLILIYFIVNKFIIQPKQEEEAFNEMAIDQITFINNSLNQYLNNQPLNTFGFKYIIDNFSQTHAAKLAAYYCGIIYFQKKKYKTAIQYFKQFSSNDEILNAINKGAIGDCYIELGQDKNALLYFEKAIKISNNHFITLNFTHKMAILAMNKKNYQKALNYYLEAKKKFPEEFDEFPQLNSYIIMLKYKNEN